MKKLLVLFVSIVLLGVCGFVSYYAMKPSAHLTASQKKQAFERMMGRQLRNPTAVPTTNTFYHGTYVSFSYPPVMQPYTHPLKKKNSSDLEMFQFQNRETHLFFTADVVNGATVAGFSDISGVMFRQQPAQGYTHVSGTIGNQPALIFTKAGEEFEKTGFVIFQHRVYSFSATGADPKEVEDTFALVAKTAVLY